MRKKLYFMVVKNGRIERSKNPFPKKLSRDGGSYNLFPVYKDELFTPKEMIKIDLPDDWCVSVEIDPQETFIATGSRFPLYPLEV